MVRAQLTGLYVYPVKSMKGISSDNAELTETGLLHDRRWMVVRGDGRFVTQRNESRLALVNTALGADGVVLSMRGHGSVAIPFESRGGAAVHTQVWQDPVEAMDEGDEVADWLTAALGSSETLRIVRLAPGFRRRLTRPERFGAGTTTQFADAAPYLVANESSLEALNRELVRQRHAPVPMNRFRPNIVLRGLEPFAEHGMAALSGDGWRLALVDHCERCLVTTIDQDTAERNKAREPYLTLRRITPVPGAKPAPGFAQNAKLDMGQAATIRVGAEVSVH
jgi:uncharacterized protein YcbX